MDCIISELPEQLYSKMIKIEQQVYFFDIHKGQKEEKILTIMKRKQWDSNDMELSLTLKADEVDLLAQTLAELKPLLQSEIL